MIAFNLPTPRLVPLDDAQIVELESILGAPVQREHSAKFVDVGPVWTVAQLASAEAVLALHPNFARMSVFDKHNESAGIVVYGAHPGGEDAMIEVRAFAPSLGVNEDPVCGSGNGSVAAFIRDAGQINLFGNEYISTQGAVVGRAGRIAVTFQGDTIRIGGHCVTCIEGIIQV